MKKIDVPLSPLEWEEIINEYNKRMLADREEYNRMRRNQKLE